MNHSRSLRVIGQKLELARVSLFQLEHDGENYTIQSDSISRTAEWMLHYASTEADFSTLQRRPAKSSVEPKPVIFSNADLTRLDHLEARRRREASRSETEPARVKLSHILRTLGDHLDKNSARSFCIFWMSNSIIIDYKRTDGLTDRLRYTPARLSEIVASASHRALPRK